jgi:hypothetical protein
MDKKTLERLMAKRNATSVGRQVVKEVDLLTPVASDEDGGDVLEESGEASKHQNTEAANISTIKATSIQETVNEDIGAVKKRGRPKSATEGLVHYSTWLPEELAWAIRGKAVALHKKDYEVVTDAIRTYMENLK